MKEDKLLDTELLISSSLRIGVYASALVIAVGLILFFFMGTSGYPGETFPTTVEAVFSGVAQGKPYAIISLGLFLLIATPVFRVFASIFVFLIEKDYLYMTITFAVFLILLFSFLFGKAI